MKKALSLILALALVISIVPTAVFAAGGENQDIVAEFSKETIKVLDSEGNIDNTKTIVRNQSYSFENSSYTRVTLAGIDGFELLASQMGNNVYTLGHDCERTNKSYLALKFVLPRSKGKTYWIEDCKDNPRDNNCKFAFTVPVKNAGWYDVKIQAVQSVDLADFYIYVNGEYAGLYKSYNENVAANYYNESDEQILNKLYITPNENERAEIVFCVAKSNSMNSFLLFKKFILSPSEAGAEFDKFETVGIPQTMTVGDTAEVTVSAYTTDGKLHLANGRNLADASVNDDLKIEVVSGDSVTVVAESRDLCEGVAEATFKAQKPGETVIKYSAVINGQTHTDTVTVTVPSENADTDAEDIDDTIAYIVRAQDSANNEKISVSDTAYEGIGKVGSWKVGESFTATANGDDFAYWANGSGAPVSTSPSYTFNPTSNFTLEAVYAPADSDTKKVQFWNYNKVFLGEKEVTSENKVEAMPADPTLNGWSFTGWKTDANTTFDATTVITDAITRVVAQFTKDAAGFNVGGQTKAYDDVITNTPGTAPEGKVFSHWTIEDQVASYEEIFKFNVWDAVDVEAVYADEKPVAVPTVVLDKVSNEEYFILYEVPAGYTAVDAGIVFGNNEPRVDSTDGSKASVKKAGAKGQFTAAPHEGAAATVKARGYVMYTDDATGALRILYTTAQ